MPVEFAHSFSQWESKACCTVSVQQVLLKEQRWATDSFLSPIYDRPIYCGLDPIYDSLIFSRIRQSDIRYSDSSIAKKNNSQIALV
jgi:hypothetical protein